MKLYFTSKRYIPKTKFASLRQFFRQNTQNLKTSKMRRRRRRRRRRTDFDHTVHIIIGLFPQCFAILYSLVICIVQNPEFHFSPTIYFDIFRSNNI